MKILHCRIPVGMKIACIEYGGTKSIIGIEYEKKGFKLSGYKKSNSEKMERAFDMAA